MATKVLVALFISCLVFAAIGAETVAESNEAQRSTRLSQAQQCRLQRLTASQPSQRIQSEAGVTELWDENEQQFQCAGVVAMRDILQPNALSLPNFHPSPRLVYVERGQGLLGVTFPGCAETYHSQSQPFTRSREAEEEQSQGQRRDQHQKVQRIRQGDIVAIPAGAAHWCFNDGNEEFVAISVNDLNHQANQLDQKFRAFYLAGGPPKRSGEQGQQQRETLQSIFRAFDPELMAEAYNISPEIIRRMQSEDERGLIVDAGEMRGIMRPGEEYEQRGGRRGSESDNGIEDQSDNGLEETLCTMKIRSNIDNRREADFYSRQAGMLHIVNSHKLPILRTIDMSAEKGRLFPNAMLSPHWSMNGHSIYYVTRGDAQIQAVDHSGQTMMNDRVNQGDMFVIPQYFTATIRAGSDGFEWVNIKTTSTPKRSPLVGYTSVIRAMPLQVLTNAYQISPREAQDLKLNRGGQSLLLSPGRTKQY